MRPARLSILSLLLTSFLVADAKVTQKTQVQFGGVIGSAVNIFGGARAKEGITSEVAVKGNRRISRAGDAAEIVDLSEEKIYNLDYKRKTYKVIGFDEVRKQFEDAREQAEKDAEQSRANSGKKDPNAKEYVVDVDVKPTGKRETINGFDTKQTIVTITIHEKGKTLEQAGGSVLTSDMWLAPRIAAVREVEDFERRYLTKLWGDAGVDLRSLTAILASAPELSKAMKELQKAKIEGTSVRTALSFHTIPDPRVKPENEEEGASASQAAAKAIGGLMNRMKKKKSEEPAQEKNGDKNAEKKAAAPESKGNMLFSSNMEVLSASSSASTSDVAVPADFKRSK